MKIAIVKNDASYYYHPRGKKFMVFGDSVYNAGCSYCAVNSMEENNYLNIFEYSNTLEKEFTGEIIRYVFSDDTMNAKITKEHYTKDGVFKRSKEVKKDIEFYLELLNNGYK